MSLALVVIPWFSYQYLREMEEFLVDSQANAQLLTAEGISTLLNGRSDRHQESENRRGNFVEFIAVISFRVQYLNL